MNNSFSYKPADHSKSVDVVFTNDFEKNKALLKNSFKNFKSPVFVVDKNLPKKYLSQVQKVLGNKGVATLYLDPSAKDYTRVIKIWDMMVKNVPDVLVAIGGGTTGDLSGFSSGTYQRGVPRIYFPTTVLSMMDVCIGGKSGIDHQNVKNSIGIIQYPNLSVGYTPFLKTLAKKEYISGFGEIVKAAVLYDKKFFALLEKFSETSDMLNYDDKKTLEVFTTSAKIKADVCEEKVINKISLLYGHAIGHALEKYNKDHLRHGDCVAIGMNLEGAIAVILGIWNEKEWKRQNQLLKNLQLPTDLPKYVKLEQLASKMTLYKKLVSKEDFLLVLPKQIGSVNNKETTCLTPVKRTAMVETIEKALIWIKNQDNV